MEEKIIWLSPQDEAYEVAKDVVLKMPVDEEDIEKYEHYHITDIQGFPTIREVEYQPLSSLNLLAELIDEESDFNYTVWEACMQHVGDDVESAVDTYRDRDFTVIDIGNTSDSLLGNYLVEYYGVSINVIDRYIDDDKIEDVVASSYDIEEDSTLDYVHDIREELEHRCSIGDESVVQDILNSYFDEDMYGRDFRLENDVYYDNGIYVWF